MSSATMGTSGKMRNRHIMFLLMWALSLVVFWRLVGPLVHFSLNHDTASQILFMPFVTLYLLYLDSKKIFKEVRPAYRAGTAVVLGGVLLYWLAASLSQGLNLNNYLSAQAPTLVIVWIGLFLFCYGPKTLRLAAFPLAFLFLVIPIPTFLLNPSILYLQAGSTLLSEKLFQLAGVPVLRSGFDLALPTVTIEVAKECSSIRSSLALVITCLLASYLFLRSAWRRTIFVLLAIPFSLVKNGIRIVTLSLLSIYVDRGFLYGRLHHEGGIVFFLIALLIMAPILFLLRRSEKRRRALQANQGSANGGLREKLAHGHEGTVTPNSSD